jgi:REP element-mobilizing transposase RayT
MMEYPYRKKNRLEAHHYSQNGAYFITICTEKRKCLLSEIVGGGVLDAPATHLHTYGAVVDRRIRQMNQVYTNAQTVKYVIMPNHVHLLICIDRMEGSTGNGTSRTPSPTNEIIPRYISTFKRLCNREFGCNIWQRSYHDRIIRDDAEYQMIWNYIDTNPIRWEQDCFYMEE